jgi:uncharacterized protein (TIGR02996 family)
LPQVARSIGAATLCWVLLQLAIVGNGVDRVVDLRDDETSFGRAGNNDIVLRDAAVSLHHAVVITRDGNSIVVDLSSEHGTWINGAKLGQPRALAVGDRLGIGPFTLDVRAIPARRIHGDFDGEEPTNPRGTAVAFAPRDATEAQLFAELDAHEPSIREVYADWLDDRGLADEAAFVRAQDQLAAVRRKGDRVALRVLGDLARAPASSLDYAWRRRVGRPTIERCAPEFEFQCPKDWGDLAPTGEPNVRYCDACAKPVYYAASIAEARDRAANRECVAIDFANPRTDRDLEAPYGLTCDACKYIAGNADERTCPRCGEALRERMMRVGRMVLQ